MGNPVSGESLPHERKWWCAMVHAASGRGSRGHGSQIATWKTPRQALVLFCRGVTVRTGSRVAVLVGTVLSIVNQGATIVDGNATVATWVRVAVNYLVPFLVSSYGFLAARRVTGRDEGPSVAGSFLDGT
jgi:hypothetical protein